LATIDKFVREYAGQKQRLGEYELSVGQQTVRFAIDEKGAAQIAIDL
jgi:hypothetical protein